MKYAPHVAILAVGFALGIWVARSGQAPAPAGTSATSAEPAKTEESPKILGSPSKSAPVKSVTATEPDLQKLQNDFDEQLDKGEMRQALLILQDLEKKAPQSRARLASESEYQTRKKDWGAARASAKKCVEAFPEARSCFRNLATAELEVGSKEDQAAAVDACLDLEPNDPQCQNMSGMVQMNRGDFSGAIAIYERLIRDNGSYGMRFPEDHLHWQLGLALEGAGRHEEALDHLENACRRNNDQACRKIEELSGGGID